MRIKAPNSNFNQRENRSTFGHAASPEAVNVMKRAEQYGYEHAKRTISSHR